MHSTWRILSLAILYSSSSLMTTGECHPVDQITFASSRPSRPSLTSDAQHHDDISYPNQVFLHDDDDVSSRQARAAQLMTVQKRSLNDNNDGEEEDVTSHRAQDEQERLAKGVEVRRRKVKRATKDRTDFSDPSDPIRKKAQAYFDTDHLMMFRQCVQKKVYTISPFQPNQTKLMNT